MAAVLAKAPWKNFNFRLADKEHLPRILNHMRNNHYRDDPLCQMVGYSDERAADLDRRISEYFEQNLTFIAEDNETGKVAGCWINYNRYRDKLPPSFTMVSSDFNSPKTFHIISFLKRLEAKCSIFENYNLDHFAEIFMVSVDRNFRKAGLGAEMHQRNIDFLGESGFKLAKGFFSSPHTRRLATKFGYEELAREYCKDFEHKNGVSMFPNAQPDQFVSVMALRL